jgi:hypothetical protein
MLIFVEIIGTEHGKEEVDIDASATIEDLVTMVSV